LGIRKEKEDEIIKSSNCCKHCSSEHWLLTTIDTVDKELNVINGINYTGTPVKEYESFFGRIIIKFHKTFQSQAVYFNTIGEELEVCQILPDIFDDDDFIGLQRKGYFIGIDPYPTENFILTDDSLVFIYTPGEINQHEVRVAIER